MTPAVAILVNALIALVLLFLGYTLRAVRGDTSEAREGIQKLQVMVAGMAEAVKGMNARIDRLEKVQDDGR